MACEDEEMSKPRERGFNYGIGFGSGPKPPAYLTGLLLSRVLNKRATVASKAAWAQEMLVREVRLAETAPEKTKAVQLLHEANERVFAENQDRFRRRNIRRALKQMRQSR